MDVKFAVLADHASLTRENKLNIMGIFDMINAESFPVILPIIYVVIQYEANVGEFDTDKDVEIVVSDEDGQVLQRLKQKLHIARPSVSGTSALANQLAGIIGAHFQKAGSYQFAILVNGDFKKSISLRVNKLKGEKQ